MYLKYMPIAKQIYDRVLEEYNNKKSIIPDYSYENFIDNLSYKILSYRTNYAVGESYADISFDLIKCLRSINLEAANQIEKEYIKSLNTKIMQKNDLSALCQKFFHCTQEHLRNTIDLLKNYYKSFAEDKLKIDERVKSLLPMIDEIANGSSVDKETMETYINKLSLYDFSEFCDQVEERIKNHFTDELNQEIYPTIDMLKKDPSKVKFLNGQDFSLLIHCASDPELLLQTQFNHGFSMSLIDEKNIRCYSEGAVKFAFYRQINEGEIALAGTSDIGTIYDDNGLWGSSFNSKFLSIKDFKEMTKQGQGLQGYSEISLAVSIKPNAIVCFDYVSKKEYELSEKYGLDLIIIQTERYENMLKDAHIDKKYRKEIESSKLEELMKKKSEILMLDTEELDEKTPIDEDYFDAKTSKI